MAKVWLATLSDKMAGFLLGQRVDSIPALSAVSTTKADTLDYTSALRSA